MGGMGGGMGMMSIPVALPTQGRTDALSQGKKD
jgi:hypothetical protein